jgi:hypothetical protein
LFFNKTVKTIFDCEGKIMNKTMLLVLTVICVMALSYYARPAFGDNGGSDAAACTIDVTVNSIVEWEGTHPQTFADIHLAAITARESAPTGSATITLWTNSDVALSADNTTASQLTYTGSDRTTKDTLITKYMISTDFPETTHTGASAAAVAASHSDEWRDYDVFLKAAANAPLAITHYNLDGNVEITLEVQATNDSDSVADTGLYQATQTITATWTGDN